MALLLLHQATTQDHADAEGSEWEDHGLDQLSTVRCGRPGVPSSGGCHVCGQQPIQVLPDGELRCWFHAQPED